MEFIHIIINRQNYLLNSEKIKEILKYPTIKSLAESSQHIEGIISHKEKVIPIVSIRKLLGFKSFSQEQIEFIEKMKNEHKNWIKEFEDSLKESRVFTKTVNPQKCELGTWIDEMIKCMRCNHNGYTDIIKNSLLASHNALHLDAKEFLQNNIKDAQSIKEHGEKTIKALWTLQENIHLLSSSFEQLIIYDIDGIDVGFIVDSVAGLHNLDEKNYNLGHQPLSKSNKFIQFIDHYEEQDRLLFSIKFTQEVALIVEQHREKELA